MRKEDQLMNKGKLHCDDAQGAVIESWPIGFSVDSNSGTFIGKDVSITCSHFVLNSLNGELHIQGGQIIADEVKLGKGSSAHLNNVSVRANQVKLEGALTLVDSQIAAKDVQMSKDAELLARRSSLTLSSNPHHVFSKKSKSSIVKKEENPQLGK